MTETERAILLTFKFRQGTITDKEQEELSQWISFSSAHGLMVLELLSLAGLKDSSGPTIEPVSRKENTWQRKLFNFFGAKR